MEEITLDVNNLEPTELNLNDSLGMEMLMNDKRGNSRNSTPTYNEISIQDLNKLESELNDSIQDDYTENNKNQENKNVKFSIFENDTQKENKKNDIKINEPPLYNEKANNVQFNVNTETEKPKLNVNNREDDKTWDGFQKFNEIPVDPEKDVPKEKPLSRQELLRKKFEYLRKLEMIEKKGVSLSKKYTMESSLDEMQGEYEMIISEKEKSNSIKFQGKILMSLVSTLEYLNNKFDPFDLKLDGWGESISENIEDYDEIFSELHEKYKSKAKLAPELKLLFQIGIGASMLHMTNSMFKSAMPSMEDILRQNPEVMQQFTNTAASAMAQNKPGFGNFMNNIMSEENQPREERFRGENYREEEEKSYRPSTNPSRKDIGMGRGIPDFKDSVNIQENYASIQKEQPRPEMKGPSDIDAFLSQVNKNETTNSKNKNTKQEEVEIQVPNITTGSTISLDELRSISKDADNIPRKSKRKPRSERNTVSLDI